VKKSYTVLTAVVHDNVRYEPDSKVTLDDTAAQALIDVKAIDASTATVVEGGETAPTDPELRHAKICEAIGMLDPANEELWTRSGKPDLAALVAVTGWNVTAAERDAAWSEVKPA
jgi:hypothetical protein